MPKLKDDDLFDLDALAREVKSTVFQFRAGGKTWSLPPYGDLDWRVLEYGDEPDLVFMRQALRLGLGDQWDEFQAITVGITAISELFGRWSTHSGVTPGESQASSGS